MKAMSVLVLAAMGVAGVVQAQTGPGQQPAGQTRTGPDGSFSDECGFRYNSRGDRIDAQGRVLPPPMTPPGGRSCK
jgi:hypothetical protein